MTDAKTNGAPRAEEPPEHKIEVSAEEAGKAPLSTEPQMKTTEKMPLTIFYHWCKACNICIAFCPQKVFEPDRVGKPIIAHPEKCTQCAFCWLHCPDLAIISNEK